MHLGPIVGVDVTRGRSITADEVARPVLGLALDPVRRLAQGPADRLAAAARRHRDRRPRPGRQPRGHRRPGRAEGRRHRDPRLEGLRPGGQGRPRGHASTPWTAWRGRSPICAGGRAWPNWRRSAPPRCPSPRKDEEPLERQQRRRRRARLGSTASMRSTVGGEEGFALGRLGQAIEIGPKSGPLHPFDDGVLARPERADNRSSRCRRRRRADCSQS